MKIVFATGRPERVTDAFAEIIRPDAIVSNNGAGACVGGQDILRKDVPPSAVSAIVAQLLGTEGIKLSLDYGSHSLTDCDDHSGWGAWNAIFTDFAEYDPNGVRKISIEAMDPALLAGVDFEALGCHCYANQGEKWYMIQEKSAVKIHGVDAVAAHFGIALSQVIAFGDDQNDIDMLRACGTGVAVANAIDRAKAAADFVCDSNDDDGPAKWIKQNLL
jgi:hydroxymethylpyrimidine pyrophosphatase-like HAD family hydrolase